MNFRYWLLSFFITLAVFLLSSCNTGNNNKKEKSVPAKQKSGITTTIKDTLVLSQTFHNGRYNFSFKLPEGWKAEDRSINGDGFYIESAWERNADIRAYAEQLLPDSDQNETCKKKSDFTFEDNSRGTFCRDSTEWYFYRIKNDVRLVFYVQADEKFLYKHENEIKQIASTLKFD